MIRTRLARVVVALGAATLIAPAFAPTATAAAPYPKVPALKAMKKVYPHLTSRSPSSSDLVRGPAKKCDEVVTISGAVSTYATYLPEGDMTGARPLVIVDAIRLASARQAKVHYPRAVNRTRNCSHLVWGATDAKVKRFKVAIGRASAGHTVRIRDTDVGFERLIAHVILVRAGKHIVTTSVVSANGKAPSRKKAVQAAALAVRAAT